jgi:hypothetical protein
MAEKPMQRMPKANETYEATVTDWGLIFILKFMGTNLGIIE